MSETRDLCRRVDENDKLPAHGNVEGGPSNKQPANYWAAPTLLLLSLLLLSSFCLSKNEIKRNN